MRVITAQGPTQLLSAIAALHFQQNTRQCDSPCDILVLGGLYSESYLQIIDACKLIATQWNFAQIIVAGIDLALSSSNPAHKFPGVKELRFLSDAKEIYVCRNWQRFNIEMIDLCKNADIVCYGDGFGVLDAIVPPTSVGLYSGEGPRCLKQIILHDPDFSQFAYSLDSIMDILETPPISYLKDVLHASSKLLWCVDVSRPKTEQGSSEPLALATLSTLSEAGWIRRHPAIAGLSRASLCAKRVLRNALSCMGLEIAEQLSSTLLSPIFKLISHQEVRMYEEHLLRHLDANSQIILKPHPRQSFNQAEFLAARLRGHGFRVLSTSRSISAAPAELILGHHSVHTLFALGSTSARGVRLSGLYSNLKINEQIDLDIRRKYLWSFALPKE